MKKLVFTGLAIIITTISYAQVAPIDFESGGHGANWTWTTFENDGNAPLEIVANPDPSGINTSSTVAKFTALQSGAPFAGVESMHGSDIGTFTLTADNAVVSIMVYKSTISNVGIKYATASNSSTGEMLIANTVVNKWEEIVFDFTSIIGEPSSTNIDQIIIFPDFTDRTEDTVNYFDNITFEDNSSFFVELPITFEEDLNYTFIGFEGAQSEIQSNPDPAGINTSETVMRSTKMENSAFFAGTFVDVSTPIDFTDFPGISIDTYSPKANIPVRLALENQTTGNQITVDVNTTTTNAWETLTFDFTGLINPNIDYNRIVVFFEFIEDLPGDGTTYYFDNLRAEDALGTNDFSAEGISVFPNPAVDICNIIALEAIQDITVFGVNGQKALQQKPHSIEATLDVSSLQSGIYFAQVTTQSGSQTLRLIKK